MQWKALLSLTKYQDQKIRERSAENPTRVGFEIDYDRIIFSNYFRSLQDKTQVVPLSKTDFVHTRLTHSLEVSVVGRSLGRVVGKAIIEKYPELEQLGYTIQDFGSIVAAASLCHDIGNPPFGHSGEKAISDYFKNGAGKRFQERVSEDQWQDLTNFEGNAHGFHLLTHSSPGMKGGLRMTFATLGAFMKYPKMSLPQKPTKDISDKKYGVFQADKEVFEEMAEQLGLLSKDREDTAYHRHPLAYLVEAADDICYTIIDFEDGINLGWIDEKKGFELLETLVKDKINHNNYQQLQKKSERIAYLRALAIGSLIDAASEVFLANEEAIMQGKFPHALTDQCRYSEQMKAIISICVSNVYKNPEVVKKEVMGYHVIHQLLEQFIQTSEALITNAPTHYDQMIQSLYPELFINLPKDLYLRLLYICSRVSLLSDGKALELYHTISSPHLAKNYQ